jgi:hypothetical protein
MSYSIDREFKALIRSLTESEYTALESSLQSEGCRDAIIVWRGYGIIVDGHNRYEICRKRGIEFRIEEKNFSDRQAVKVWILKNQLARRNLTDGERFEVAVLLKDALAEIGREKMSEGGGDKKSEAAKSGLLLNNKPDNPTSLEETPRHDTRAEKKEGLLLNNKPSQSEPAKEEPKHDTRKEIASNLGWSPAKVAQAEVIRKEDPEKWDEVKAGTKTVGAAYTEVKKPHVANNSGENEWYTPPKYTEAARHVMGGIDLDPASNSVANGFVKADSFYTKEDDGLMKPWYGRVWLNPPYAQPLIAQFAEAVVEKYAKGEFEQAIVLVNNATDTKWLQSMMRVCSAICFSEGRIRFMNPKGDPVGAPLQGQVFLYFGGNVESFLDEFASFGVAMHR